MWACPIGDQCCVLTVGSLATCHVETEIGAHPLKYKGRADTTHPLELPINVPVVGPLGDLVGTARMEHYWAVVLVVRTGWPDTQS